VVFAIVAAKANLALAPAGIVWVGFIDRAIVCATRSTLGTALQVLVVRVVLLEDGLCARVFQVVLE
jgi:hypothetical protein